VHFVQGHRRLRLWSSQSGFTLIELLGVMVIVLLLSTVAVTVFINVTEKVRLSASSGKLTELEKALERYQVDKGRYPSNLTELVRTGYVRVPMADDELVHYAVFASPWYDKDNPRYFYYYVPSDKPRSYLLVDPTPDNCQEWHRFCEVTDPETSQPAPPQDWASLDRGWRSSGNWN
jgi:prepilin-type N-terminal cleavage/methylation domain-containing protein